MKDLISPENLSPIQLAKKLMNFKGMASSTGDFEQIKSQLVPDEILERVNQIVKGLEQEDEFAVLCRVMETCTSLSRIDQNPIVSGDEKAPDFLATFESGCSVTGKNKNEIKAKYHCFIEVKSCKGKRFKISEKDLKRRKSFSDRYKIPLVFAIRFTLFEGHCYWILIESNKLSKQGRKVEIDSLVGNLGPVLFDDYGVFTHPQLCFAHYYDASSKEKGIRHKKYGVLVRTNMLLPNQEPIEIDEENSVLINTFIDAFDFKQLYFEKGNNITVVVSSIGSQMRFLSDLIYRVNNLAREENGEPVYDATRVVASVDSKNISPLLFTRSMIEHAIYLLNRKEMVLFKISIGEPKNQEKVLKSLARKG